MQMCHNPLVPHELCARYSGRNEFQRSLFVLRQNEWDVYRKLLPVTQGDLADPAYFDFMSFCQYATIADGMRNGRLMFEVCRRPHSHVAQPCRQPSKHRDRLSACAHRSS